MSHKDPCAEGRDLVFLTELIWLQVSGEDPQRIDIMVASHNEDTVIAKRIRQHDFFFTQVRYGVGRMAELGLDPQVKLSTSKEIFTPMSI